MTEQYFGISLDDIVGQYQEILEKQLAHFIDIYQEEIIKTNDQPASPELLQLYVHKYVQILMDKIHIYLQNYLVTEEEVTQIQSHQQKQTFDQPKYEAQLNAITDTKNQAKAELFSRAVKEDLDQQAQQAMQQQQAFQETFNEKSKMNQFIIIENMLQRLSEQIIKEGQLGEVLLRSKREQAAEKEKGKTKE